MMYREVERFRQRTGKPVVALMMDVAASGGYYLAVSADHIVTYPTTVTGSIGVLVQTISVKPALSRIGIEARALTSGPNKDAGSPFNVMTEDQQATLQHLVDTFYGRFTDLVRQRRPDIPEDRFAMVTDGRVVTGVDAVELGLADEVGDLYDAFARAKDLAGIDAAKLIVYHRPLEYVASAYAGVPAAPGVGTQVNIAQFNLGGLVPGLDPPFGFYYLWQPQWP
jgi:protease-4